MTNLVVVGTDTNAGKTSFCAQWLAAFGDRFAYWKPVETGESDTEAIGRMVPAARIFQPLARFRDAVAPALAAERAGRPMPGVGELQTAVPVSPLPLLIETFGGPLSPLTNETLQVDLLAAWRLPMILVGLTTVGAVTRTLQTLAGLREHGMRPIAVVLMGEPDEFAASQITAHSRLPVVSLRLASGWDEKETRIAARENAAGLERILALYAETAAGAVCPPVEAASPGRQLVERDRLSVWHPYTPLGDALAPLPVVGVEAEFLELADGRRLIDGISSWWTILHGHRYPPLMSALREASLQWDHVLFAGVTHAPGVALAEHLLATAPWTGGRVFYSDNGSTAVEVALKMAYQTWCHRGQPGRTLFVGFEGGFHGDTFGAMAAARDPLFAGRFAPLLFPTLRVPVSAERLASVLAANRGNVAAVIIEPLVQGAGGMRMHTPAELRAIHDAAREHDVLFIVDEVMTGGGRTGSQWAHEQAGIAPDLICASKTLTGGIMPLAATLASPEIVAAFDTSDRARTFFHGHSFTAHPLACAVAAANWAELRTGRWRADVQRIESIWRERLLPLAGRPGVRDVRILGSIAAIEVFAEGGYLAEIGPRFRRRCLDMGVFLRPLGNVLYAMPPYRTSDTSLHRIADAMIACVDGVRGTP